MVILALMLAVAEPSGEALALGRQIAESGTLASLLPLMQQKETEELVAAHKELIAAEQEKLRATAAKVYETGRERLMRAEARAYAEKLSVDNLRAVAAFQTSAAGTRQRAAMPGVIADTMQNVGKIDFKAEVVADFCKETGKLCDK